MNMSALAKRPATGPELAVFLDAQAPRDGAFAFALDWARRLSWGIRLIAAGDESSDIVETCSSVCEQRGLRWGVLQTEELGAEAARYAIAPGGFYVIGHVVPAARRTELLQHIMDQTDKGIVVCPNHWGLLERVLVLHQDITNHQCFLENAAQLCARFAARPIILTVARSERLARHRQQAARDTLAALNVAADFDYLVSVDIRTEVSNIARWRRCQLVVVPRPNTPRWWRWLRGNHLAGLLYATSSLAFVTLPDATQVPHFPEKPVESGPFLFSSRRF